MARRTKKPVVAEGPLARTLFWQGLQPHDEVRVKGKPGQRRHYEFLAFVQNTDTEECFVEVLGGRLERDGTFQHNIRMFPPELCSPPPRRRRPRQEMNPEIIQLTFEYLGGADPTDRA